MERINIFTKKDTKQNIVEYQALPKDIAELDILEDRTFKVFLSDYELLSLVIEAITGNEIQDGTLYEFNQSIIIKVKGKKIEMDVAIRTNDAYYNIEGQNITKDFTFKRHLFYWSVIFASQLQKSDEYNSVKPVVSIVIYKNKSGKGLRQTGYLSGDIFDNKTDRELLSLISINAKKWKDSENKKLKMFLSIISNGVYTEEKKDLFTGIDVLDPLFQKFNSEIKIICSEFKREEAEKKGDIKMAELYKSVALQELREAREREKRSRIEGKIEGRIEGEIKGEIKLGYKFKLTPEQLAKETGITVEQVVAIIEELKSEGKI